ncbi:hypothetical protein BKE38_19835 [Pseudoroseomonas deserti]|uniref:DUF1622 domain-containing protein n=1 Tax=Teichococcus deserti TaxID=1817963 RepID=A0A1V2GY25_9PROT|nr:DUF1622 domain-containing protein [Pseudoroseomonas deserti]ONG50039.1 hypothetical protein BKE38_19835 [Pseudoroseomonas deserti]
MTLTAHFLAPLAVVLEVVGVGVIMAGVTLAAIGFARDWRREGAEAAYLRGRANLGRGILLGLEVLIGADIIATIVAPLTWESVGLLGLVVLIRTFLSFSLEAEIDGEWPWRRKQREG